MNMHVPVDLGDELERIVARLIREGSYASRDEVLRAGVHMVDQYLSDMDEKARGPVPDGPDLGDDEEAIREGLADIEAGRVIDAETVFRELRARYSPR